MFLKSIVILHGRKRDESGVLKLTANGSDMTLKASYNTPLSAPLRLVLDVGEVFTFITDQESEHSFRCTKFTGVVSAVAFDGISARLIGSTDKNGGNCQKLIEEYKKPKEDEEALDVSKPQARETYEQKEEPLGSSDLTLSSAPLTKQPKESGVSSVSYGKGHVGAFDSSFEYQGNNFYLAVKPQLDEMFVCYPREEKLESAVANSKWVKVDCETDYYVVGIIYDIDEPQYICYGIPGSYNIKPPEEIEPLCDWLPLDSGNKFGDGYWMIFQNAENGKCVRRGDGA